ncbi:MAG TPA: transposase [Chloroflexia bacterium]|nr:transposase [Chloroflexia bacterium]
MSSANKTIKLKLEYRPSLSECFAHTKALFNRVASFYFEVIQAHPAVLELSAQAALTKLEQLTHVTKTNLSPVMPLLEVAPGVPALFRRAAIHAALGAARSFFSSLEKWRKEKAKFEATVAAKPHQLQSASAGKGPRRKQRQAKEGAKAHKFTKRPPVPPRSWNRSVTFYAGQYKELTQSSVMLRLWDGTNWRWLKFSLSGRVIPPGEGWEAGSPQVVKQGKHDWRLHLPLVKQFASPGKLEKQLKENPGLKVCAVDLNINEHLAVCTVQTAEGTVTATRFIGGGKQLHGFRKRLLGRVAINRSKTGLIAEGEQDNKRLWQKIRHLDEDMAHQVSHRIIEFARENGANILVFEHLANFKPEKGRYSKRSNEKRSYWLRGRIFHHTRYKAWSQGIVTSRVSPYNTSRECARCHAKVARYREGDAQQGYRAGAPLVYCPNCEMWGNADRNASIGIGQRFFARYQNNNIKNE